MVAHHIADVLRFEDFELTTEREKERDEFVVRDNVDGYAVLFVVIMLRGVQGFVLYIRIAIGRDAHNDMLAALADGANFETMNQPSVEMDADLDNDTVVANVLANEKIAAFLAKQEGQIRKTIVVKNKLVNLIVK